MRSVIRPGLLLVLLAQLAGVGAVGAQSPAGPRLLLPAGFRALYQQLGWQAIVVDGTVVVVEAGFTHPRGIDDKGQTRWRTQYPPAPRGIQELFAFAGGALVYAGRHRFGTHLLAGRCHGCVHHHRLPKRPDALAGPVQGRVAAAYARVVDCWRPRPGRHLPLQPRGGHALRRALWDPAVVSPGGERRFRGAARRPPQGFLRVPGRRPVPRARAQLRSARGDPYVEYSAIAAPSGRCT